MKNYEGVLAELNSFAAGKVVFYEKDAVYNCPNFVILDCSLYDKHWEDIYNIRKRYLDGEYFIISADLLGEGVYEKKNKKIKKSDSFSIKKRYIYIKRF
jgi:hypothetical protein